MVKVLGNTDTGVHVDLSTIALPPEKRKQLDKLLKQNSDYEKRIEEANLQIKYIEQLLSELKSIQKNMSESSSRITNAIDDFKNGGYVSGYKGLYEDELMQYRNAMKNDINEIITIMKLLDEEIKQIQEQKNNYIEQSSTIMEKAYSYVQYAL